MNTENALPTAIVVPASAPNAYGIIRSLAEQGVPVLALDHSSSPLRRSRLCRFQIVPDPNDGESAFIEALVRTAKGLAETPVLFPSQDLHAFVVQNHQDVLRDSVRFPFMPVDRFAACVDKELMLRRAALAGLAIPRTFRPIDAAQVEALLPRLARFPCIIKPVAKFDLRPNRPPHNMAFFRTYGTKAIRAAGAADLRRLCHDAFRRGFEILVQEEIEGPTEALSAVDFYVDRGGQISGWHTGRKIRQFPADFGTCTLGRSAPVDGILSLCRRFVDAVGFRGLGNMEFKEKDGIHYLMEINPRAWMWIQMATAAGVNLPWRAYLDLLDLPEPVARDVRQGTTWVDLRMDILHRLGSTLSQPTEHVGWNSWLGSLTTVRVEARTTARDPGPVLDALIGAAARRIRP